MRQKSYSSQRSANKYQDTHRTIKCGSEYRTHRLSKKEASTSVFVVDHKRKTQIEYTNIHYVDNYVESIAKAILQNKNPRKGTQITQIDEIYDSDGNVYYRSIGFADALRYVTPC